MTTTTTTTLRYGKGFTGHLGRRPYVARIRGTDEHYGFRRDFLEPTTVIREHYTRSRTMVYLTYELTLDGLYELSAEGEKSYIMCYLSKDTAMLTTAAVSRARLTMWVYALDHGKTDREARLASRGSEL